jgi:VanZ family protein
LNQSGENLKSSRRLRILFSWTALVAWAILIFLFSAQPSLGTGWGIWDFVLRKMAHMGEFAVLFMLVRHVVRMHGAAGRISMVSGVAIALMYAVSDEYHQSFVPGRTASVRDVLFDLAGILIGIALVVIIKKRAGTATSSV